MEVIEEPNLLAKTLKNKNCTLSSIDYSIAIRIFKASPKFGLLKKMQHLEIERLDKKDLFSIKLDQHNNRMTFKKLSDDCIQIISII